MTNFDELETNEILFQEMGNKHYVLIVDKNRKRVRYVQFSIGENFRYGYRSATKKDWNNKVDNSLSNYEFVDSFSSASKDILVYLFEKDRVRDLPEKV
jgi:hypothetical protein